MILWSYLLDEWIVVMALSVAFTHRTTTPVPLLWYIVAVKLVGNQHYSINAVACTEPLSFTFFAIVFRSVADVISPQALHKINALHTSNIDVASLTL
jgi:hypothetical protein